MMKSIKITQQNAKIWKSETQFKNHQNTLSVKINEHGTVNKQSRNRRTRTVAARREGGGRSRKRICCCAGITSICAFPGYYMCVEDARQVRYNGCIKEVSNKRGLKSRAAAAAATPGQDRMTTSMAPVLYIRHQQHIMGSFGMQLSRGVV